VTRAAAGREPVILTPDHRLRVFVSSTLEELAPERAAAREAIEHLHLSPVMFELGARPHAPRTLYRAYLDQSDLFVGIYWQRYGWIAPGDDRSGLEDEYHRSTRLPSLLYIKEPAPERDPRLEALLERVRVDERASYRRFADADELTGLLRNDLIVLLTERFVATSASDRGPRPARPRTSSVPPRPATPTFGRDDAVATTVRLLSMDGARLLTITGPGGVGKSRLALEAATRLTGAFPDGIHLVPLEPIDDPTAVLPVVADRLGVVGEVPATSSTCSPTTSSRAKPCCCSTTSSR
jgi:hypothetical protein